MAVFAAVIVAVASGVGDMGAPVETDADGSPRPGGINKGVPSQGGVASAPDPAKVVPVESSTSSTVASSNDSVLQEHIEKEEHKEEEPKQEQQQRQAREQELEQERVQSNSRSRGGKETNT